MIFFSNSETWPQLEEQKNLLTCDDDDDDDYVFKAKHTSPPHWPEDDMSTSSAEGKWLHVPDKLLTYSEW